MTPSVTIVLPSLSGGGAERVMGKIANGLARRGARVTVAVGSATGPVVSDLSSAVRLQELHAASMPAALVPLARHLRRSRPTAVLAAMTHANVITSLAHGLAGSRSRLVLSEHVNPSSLFAEYRDGRTRAMRLMMRLAYARADRIVAVSDGVARDLALHAPRVADRIERIYNPVVDEELHALAQAAPDHPWLARAQVPVVLAAGRLIPLKEFSTLIDAFAQVRQQRRARLVILGEGELRAALKAQAERLGIARDVDLPGFTRNPYAAMRSARVFALSSRFEGLANVLVEAMACGTRVVSTDCPSGPREILEDGRWGALVPVGDAPALAKAIAAALDDPTPPDVRRRAETFGAEEAIERYAKTLGLAEGSAE